MSARIVSIGTAVPPTAVNQDALGELFAAQPGADRLAQRRISGAFSASGITTRHTVLSALGGEPDGMFLSEIRTLLSPTTGQRNDLYQREAPPLAAESAQEALNEAQLSARAITHLITVSCTGFFAPGLDFRLIQDLGLPPTVARLNLGFIGCAAALPALRTATQMVESQPGSTALVVCVELCSLHVRRSTEPQQIVASSVFADGAAAAVVTSDEILHPGSGLRLERFATGLTSQGETDMTWSIGDYGFDMILSPEVPKIIGREIRAATVLIDPENPPEAWAIHPGGRSVLDRVQAGLELAPDLLEPSRTVLRDYGNMSSATVLFILRRLLVDPGISGSVAALAFGPGLTVESAVLSRP